MSLDAGLYDSLRRTGGSLLALLQTRAELAALELGEAGGRVLGALLLGLLGLMLVGFALLGLSAAVVLAAWPHWGLGALLAVAAVDLAIGLALLAGMRARLRAMPPLLDDSLRELQRDAALLQRAGREPPR
ncbi:phage holin family protein [Piscinibacter sakaiensis]|uniref:Putative transmembrane protein n=1 Tax=Piscinibacter sakaiensis TaxID=1547922 RepID=A0A0K8P1J7_PISS1|nr:phage holin family protein [Piscinibacter sakaiensis]GAP36045.1 putative transmembrane protein [Piscinibacter sakaiensis]